MRATDHDLARSGYRPTSSAMSRQPLPAAKRKTKTDPSAWVGLGLMVANTVVALVDLFLLAGSIPH
jgi:hypothetical protein